ncbi:helix-hairpin-helix domain-containing protein [Streptomyces sp. HSG2]|uniref:helix-hairpin-helix domain-containing protein n=1 Tax=Streptomyces sp. HSG2 TaxID=2797167 RepID=UPI001F5BD749|nr:helix-hairpin-helix domain-containing protein [Streptomyces sp. HSG2]
MSTEPDPAESATDGPDHAENRRGPTDVGSADGGEGAAAGYRDDSTGAAGTEEDTAGTGGPTAADDTRGVVTPEPAPSPTATDGHDGHDGHPGADDRDEPKPSHGPATRPDSEAEAELAAQRVERERIRRRQAEKGAPVDAGGKLSGRAADLLAAVRAVESGQAPPPSEAAPARPAPAERPATSPTTPVPADPLTPEALLATRRVLADGGAPESLAPSVTTALGEHAAATLREDPWQVLRVSGVRPEQADAFAAGLLGPEYRPDDERRGRALVVARLAEAAASGHTAMELPRLVAAVGALGVAEPDAAVRAALAVGEALAFQDGLEGPGDPPEGGPADHPGELSAVGGARRESETESTPPVRVLIGLERYALAEESLADALARLAAATPRPLGPDEGRWEETVVEAARPLLRAVAGHGLVLHVSGEAGLAEPAALLDAARRIGRKAWATSPAALGHVRFAALVEHAPEEPPPPVIGLAGLLAGQGPGRTADGFLDLDLLAVVDADRLDVETAALLAESLPDGVRLVLSGDPQGLRSTGPGQVFGDLLESRICPRIDASSPEPGPLGALVSAVRAGGLPRVDSPGKEVVVVPVRDGGEAVHRTLQLVLDSVPRAFGLAPEDVRVVTAGHGGPAGTRALNAALKERLNPGPGRYGGFDPGDRVLWSPGAGRVVPAVVAGADAEGLRLSHPDGETVVPRERVADRVRRGWALTAHQAAGGRWPAVVAVLPGDAAPALSRAWAVTTFGRATRHLSVVQGVGRALPEAVAAVPAERRTTRLAALLAAHASVRGGVDEN